MDLTNGRPASRHGRRCTACGQAGAAPVRRSVGATAGSGGGLAAPDGGRWWAVACERGPSPWSGSRATRPQQLSRGGDGSLTRAGTAAARVIGRVSRANRPPATSATGRKCDIIRARRGERVPTSPAPPLRAAEAQGRQGPCRHERRPATAEAAGRPRRRPRLSRGNRA